MNNPRIGSDAIEHLKKIIPDTHETRLIGLTEACKIVVKELEQGNIEFAKLFLNQAIAEAQKPWDDKSVSS